MVAPSFFMRSHISWISSRGLFSTGFSSKSSFTTTGAGQSSTLGEDFFLFQLSWYRWFSVWISRAMLR